MSDSVMVAPPRKPTGRGSRRGRKPTSCTQCHLRKQKCDRNQPCNRCLQRGVAHLCGDSTNNGVFKISESPQVVTIAPPSPSPRPRRVTQPPMSPSLGSLFANRGARAFYGSSYFGHQVASRILSEEGQDLPAGISRGRDTLQSFRDESSSFAQVWDLLGLLPRQKSTVDRLVDIFLTEVNWSLDAVHEATFRSSYDEFWGRRFGFDDLANVDLRWLGLLFIILAFGVLLDSPPHPTLDVQREREEASLRFYVCINLYV